MAKRRILFIKMDAFYASIEQRENPDLKDKPIAIGSTDKKNGVVTSPSYRARRSGVNEAEATKTAKKKCPRIIILPPRMSLYKKESAKVKVVLKRYTPQIEVEAIDKFYLDITEPGLDMTSAIMVAQRIKEDLMDKLELTASIGVAENKFLAKIAAELNHPDGLTAILPQNMQNFIDDLPVEKFLNTGRANMKKLSRLNAKKGRDVREMLKKELILHFGNNGLLYYNLVRGVDERPVEASNKEKNIFVEKKYRHPLDNKIDVLAEMERLNKKFIEAIPKTGIKDLRLTLRQDNFKTIPRRLHFEKPIKGEKKIKSELTKIFNEIYSEKKINLLRITTTTIE